MKQDKKNKSCLLKVTKRRKEKTQINKIREDKENIRTEQWNSEDYTRIFSNLIPQKNGKKRKKWKICQHTHYQNWTKRTQTTLTNLMRLRQLSKTYQQQKAEVQMDSLLNLTRPLKKK
jgi:hypothetical protein